MDNGKHKLGIKELYFLGLTETDMENSPAFKVTLTENVDIEKLRSALSEALSYFPVFSSALDYRSEALIFNDGALPITELSLGKSDARFGKETGGYLFRICAGENTLIFEWSRILSDEYGACDFLAAILSAYFGERITPPSESEIDVFLETLNEKREKPEGSASGSPTEPKGPTVKKKKDYSKIKGAKIPTRKNPHGATVHTLRASLSEILAVAERENATAESVLIPIFSNVLHRRATTDDAIITADVTLNCRSEEIKSMRNFTVTKTITYSDILGKTDFKKVVEMYDKMLTAAKDSASIKQEAKRTVDEISGLVNIRPRFVRDLASLVVAKALLKERNDFSFVNIGKMHFSDSMMRKIKAISLFDAPSFTDATISMLQFRDEIIITIAENYIDGSIVPDFIGICARLGISIREEACEEFASSLLKIK